MFVSHLQAPCTCPRKTRRCLSRDAIVAFGEPRLTVHPFLIGPISATLMSTHHRPLIAANLWPLVRVASSRIVRGVVPVREREAIAEAWPERVHCFQVQAAGDC